MSSFVGTAFLAILLAVAIEQASSAYVLSQDYKLNNFFNNFTFWTANDPTHGYVNYVSKAEATTKKMIKLVAATTTTPAQVYIGVNAVGTPTSLRGRDSVRIHSNVNYTKGLFVLDVAHTPYGCGVWPAFWSYGDEQKSWPMQGEIDIIENVNTATYNMQVLHSDAGCAMGGQSSTLYSGYTTSTDCNAAVNNNAGCGIAGATGSYGSTFNTNKGGVYAMEWTDTFIRMFFLPRGSTLITNALSAAPAPSTWGKPVAYFTIGTNCPKTHFYSHKLVFNIALCGDWAGSVFASSCPTITTDCATYVKNNPTQFTEAYWLIRSLKVYKLV